MARKSKRPNQRKRNKPVATVVNNVEVVRSGGGGGGKLKSPVESWPNMKRNVRVSAEKQALSKAAVTRLKALNDILKAPPKPILLQLEDLGIPFKIVPNVPEQPQYHTVVILLEDIKAADKKLLEAGSIYERLYRD